MNAPAPNVRHPVPVVLLVSVGGAAALSWEALWQLKASLALGVSALGTALTLAATMAGMTVGALAVGRVLARRPVANPTRLYGLLELAIGASGLLMLSGFALLERIDAQLYGVSPTLASVGHALGIMILLGPPTFAMGATIPLFELMARSHRTSVAVLYGLNTAGASAGLLVSAFFLLPRFGVSQTCMLVAATNVGVFLAAQLAGDAPGRAAQPRLGLVPSAPFARAASVVFATGFATFGLEVAWFRSLRAAFQSTTESFAITLASVLIPLAISARMVPWMRSRIGAGTLLGLAAAAILLATPVIERMDLIVWGVVKPGDARYAMALVVWFAASLITVGPAMFLLGSALPRYLDEFSDPSQTGRLYALNTFGAVCGAILSAWVLLPSVGFARSSWILGLGILPAALLVARPATRIVLSGVTLASFVLATMATSSIGRDRVQSPFPDQTVRIIDYDEGPDSTVSVIQLRSGHRVIVIDGFMAAAQHPNSDYMEWMGRLPAILHRNPQRSLVVAFGTGRTAHGLRDETLGEVDVVEISPAVLRMAPHFRSNHGVLHDPRVRAITMDGRAWVRRTDTMYDVITLEPMPPHLAGTNALYSKNFYELLAARLRPGGIVAQWVPTHLLPPFWAASSAAAFRAVFPDSALWLHAESSTGILLGRLAGSPRPIGSEWPGLERERPGRGLSADEIRAALTLGPAELERWASQGKPVTDDNQLLAYGVRRQLWDQGGQVIADNLRAFREAAVSGRDDARRHDP